MFGCLATNAKHDERRLEDVCGVPNEFATMNRKSSRPERATKARPFELSKEACGLNLSASANGMGQTDDLVAYTVTSDLRRSAALGVTSVRPAGASCSTPVSSTARDRFLNESRVRPVVTISRVPPTRSSLPFVVVAPEPANATRKGHVRQVRYAACNRTVRRLAQNISRTIFSDRNNSPATKIGRSSGVAVAAVTALPACLHGRFAVVGNREDFTAFNNISLGRRLVVF